MRQKEGIKAACQYNIEWTCECSCILCNGLWVVSYSCIRWLTDGSWFEALRIAMAS